MRLLIVGNSKSVLIRDLVRNLQRNQLFQINILDIYNGELIVDISSLNTSSQNSSSKLSFIKKNLSFFYNLICLSIKLRKVSGKYDACNIHLVDARYILILKLLKLKSKKIISSIYGSDFYHFKKYDYFLKKIYNNSKFITFANEKTMQEFNSYYHQKHAIKLRLCRFGNSNLETILKKTYSVSELYKTFNLPIDKIIVTCAYHSGFQHQHEKIIEELSKLEDSIKDKVFFLFPMTYGGHSDRIALVKDLLIKHNLSGLVLDKFLSEEENLKLRILPQILINVPITDQLSATLQETIFAGNIIITGSWLPYAIFDSYGLDYYKVNSLSEIKERLTTLIQNYTMINIDKSKNQKIIWTLSCWENTIQNWIDVYTN